MADRMAVLKDGRISQCGTPRELYDHPANRFCASFLGDINFIDGEVAGNTLVTPAGKFSLSCAGSGASCGAIRPERIRFAAPGTSGAFPAEIIRGTFLGDSAEWLCSASGVELAVRESAPPVRAAGDQVMLIFDDGFLLGME